MKPSLRLLPALLLPLAVVACQRGPTPEQLQEAAKANAAKMAYEKTIRTWRVERLQRLTKPDGWLSLVGMHWLDVGETRVGSGPANGTRVAAGPARIGVVTVERDGTVRFVAESDAGITIDGQPAAGSVVLHGDDDKAHEP